MDKQDIIKRFNWNPYIDINGNATETDNATFPIGDYFAWFPEKLNGTPYNGWVNSISKDETEITVYNSNWSEKKCKKRHEDDKSRKFVTFDKNKENKQGELYV